MPAVNPVNAAQEPSSLKQAMDRILGINTGGGGWGEGGPRPQESAVQLPVRDKASNLEATLKTPVAFDPFAAEQAEFDKKLAELQSWNPTGSTGVAGTPVAAAISAQDQALLDQLISGKNPYAAANYKSGQQQWVPYSQAAKTEASYHAPNEGYSWSLIPKPGQTSQQWRDQSLVQNPAWMKETYKQAYDAIKRDFGLSGDSAQQVAEMYSQLNPAQLYNIKATQLGVPMADKQAASQKISQASAAKAALREPTNPGPRAPWQQSAQYWKDLESYRKAMGI